ncbi:23S rRNA (guanosine(2251)-2'-O)-methyltransferase RlmB [Parvibaculum lavamentivorans]|nr:23S rRNA (guanosine(2251)-2'-O)-methyltransferase RlmB [Parvibaculum lavamentivorans]
MNKRKQPNARDTGKSGQNRRKAPTHHKTRARKASKGSSAPQDAYLYGLHAVSAALANSTRNLEQLICTTQVAHNLVEARLTLRIKPDIAAGGEISALLPPGAVHQGIALKTPSLPEPDLSAIAELGTAPQSNARIAILDQVTDPHNVGAILRSAAVFGMSAIVMTERNSPPQSGVLAKSASGALEHVSICRVGNLARAMETLAKQSFTMIGLDGDSSDELSALDLSGPVALVLGAEGAGMRRLTREYCDWLARLPASGPMRSLNVSNAAAVAFYELARKT